MSKTSSVTRGAVQITDEQRIIATIGQQVFTFVGVPSLYKNYMMFRNNGKIYSEINYTASGNDITIIDIVDEGDIIDFFRIK